VSLTLESDRAPKRTFSFGLVNDQMFTPLLASAILNSTLASYERQFGSATFRVRGTATLRNHETIAFDNVFAGDQPSVTAAMYVAAPIAALLGNDYEKIDLEALSLTVASAEEPRTATLQRAWLDDQRVRAGRTVPLKVLLRTYRGDEVLRTIGLDIPPNSSGRLSVLVSDGGRLAQIEQREVRAAQPQPKNVEQMIRTLNKSRRNNIVYVKLLGSEPGAVINGELLSQLPPSVLGVLEADRSAGSFNPLQSATLGEWEIPVEYAVSGSRTLSIAIAQD
jgi:hypothetical protein